MNSKKKNFMDKIIVLISLSIVIFFFTLIALGEKGNLPEQIQVFYNGSKAVVINAIVDKKEPAIDLAKVQEKVPFTGLEIEGLNHVFQNNRWEYVDSSDGLVAGYWVEKEGRFELTGNVLIDRLRAYCINDLESNLEPVFDYVVEKYFEETLTKGESYLKKQLDKIGIETKDF